MNKNKEPYPNEDKEVDLRELIMTLWNGKWIIIGLCIIAIVGAGVYTVSFTEPIYEADASLLIMPPTYTTSLDVSTLPVNTYRNIALTNTIKQEIIDELDLKKEDDSSYTVANLEKKMTFEVSRQETGRAEENGIQYPFFVMKVKGVDPERCSKIANTWADKFMAASKEIRKSEVKEISSVIIEQFEDTKKELKNAREELKNFKKESRLELKTSKLDMLKNKLSEYENKYLSLGTQLGSEKTKLNEIESQLNQMKDNGKWAGKLTVSENSDSILYENKKNYLKAQEKLLTFQQNNNIDIIKQEIEVRENRLKEYKEKLAIANENFNNFINENKEINNLLENEPIKLKLNRDLSNDFVWENIFKTDELEILKNLSISNEIINPTYEQLKNKFTENKISIESLPEQIKFYETKIKSEEKEIESLKNKLYDWNQQEERLKSDLENYKKIYQNEVQTYRGLVSDKLESELKIDSLKAQADFYKEKYESTKKDIKELQDEIWEAEIKEKSLTQRVNDIEKTYSMLSEKVEEARLTEAQRTSDVKFIAEAVPPTESIGTNLKLNVAIAGVLALMLGAFIIFFKEMMTTDEVN